MSAIKELEKMIETGKTPPPQLIADAMKEEKARRAKPKKKAAPVVNPSEGDEGPAYRTAIHVYQGENETDGQTRVRASRERADHGPAVVVFQHLHGYADPCQPSCKMKVED